MTTETLKMPTDCFIPLQVTNFIPHPVLFRPKLLTEKSVNSAFNGQKESKTNGLTESPLGSSYSTALNIVPIFDVLETNRPPALPNHWFHPPKKLGPIKWTYTKSVGRGLFNYANTCFLNATIQALAYCPPFAQDCLKGEHTARCLRRRRGEVCGFCQFELHVKCLFVSRNQNYSKVDSNVASFPSLFLKLLRREIRLNEGIDWFGEQNCAHEWLVQFLDFLTKYDLPPEQEKEFQSGRLAYSELSTCYVQQMFNICCQLSKMCRSCQKSTSHYQISTYIQVNVRPTLEMALEEAFQSQMLSGGNRPTCESCGVLRDKINKERIYRPPNILVITVLRTEHRNSGSATENNGRNTSTDSRYLFFDSKVKKNSTQMKIPLNLSLMEFMSEEGKDLFCPNDKEGKNYDYTLAASVCHSGSAGFGHYWTIVYGPDGFYYKIDDESISQVSPSSLLERLGSSYILFYIRKTLVDTTAPIVAAGDTVKLYRSIYASDERPDVEQDRNDVLDVQPWSLRLSLGIRCSEESSMKNVNVLDKQVDVAGQLSRFPVEEESTREKQRDNIEKTRNFITGIKTGDQHQEIETNTEKSIEKSRRLSNSISSFTSATKTVRKEMRRPFTEMTMSSVGYDRSNAIEIANFKKEGKFLSSSGSFQGDTKLVGFSFPSTHQRECLSKRLRRAQRYAKILARLPSLRSKRNFNEMNSELMKTESYRSPYSTLEPLRVASQAPCVKISQAIDKPATDLGVSDNYSDSKNQQKQLPKKCCKNITEIRGDVELDVALPSAPPKLRRKYFEKFNPDTLTEKSKSSRSQYSGAEVGYWDEEDDTGTMNDTKAFQNIQKELLPKTEKRSRHDKEYDKGKLKKVKEKKSRHFNFRGAADRLVTKMKR